MGRLIRRDAEYQKQSSREDPCTGSDLVVCSDCERPLPSHLFIDYKYSGKRGGCPHCGGIPRFKDSQSIESSEDEKNTSFLQELRKNIITAAIILCVSAAIPSMFAIAGKMTWPEAILAAIVLFAINWSGFHCVKRGEVFWG